MIKPRSQDEGGEIVIFSPLGGLLESNRNVKTGGMKDFSYRPCINLSKILWRGISWIPFFDEWDSIAQKSP